MPFLDRDSFIGLLERLGDPDDAVALAAARDIDRRMTEAGIGWDELLVPAEAGAPEAESESASTPASTPTPAPAPVPTGDAASDLEMVDALLDRGDISEATREDLIAFRQDIEGDGLAEIDRNYLHGLYRRLSAQGDLAP